MDVVYDEHKLTELIIYLADRLAGDRAGGSTKLNKVLFFADFTHVRRHGRPITGAEYQHLPFGPAPRRLLPIRSALIERGDADLVEEKFLGRRQHRLIARRPAALSAFSDAELATIDSVLEDLAGMTATQVSTPSHEEAAWRHTEDGERIPYELALVPTEQVVTPTAERVGAEIARRYQLSDVG
ncbi:MAG: hypothetical protein CL424_16975 [Acidimicrobiaceae bacterium]|nr:hypothetical protein [Acidimicrobiaceae bacterium]